MDALSRVDKEMSPMDERCVRVELADDIPVVTVGRQEALNSEIIDSLHRLFHALGKEDSHG